MLKSNKCEFIPVFLVIIFSYILFSSCGKIDFMDLNWYQEIDSTKWELKWEENFDKIDTSIWSKCKRGRSDWSNFMSNQDTCYDVIEGQLVLRGFRNDFDKSDTASYLTGGLWTRNSAISFSKGRIEIKAKFTSNQGAWPALWVRGVNNVKHNYAEIDFMEHLNHEDVVYQTVHSTYTIWGGKANNLFIPSIDRRRYNVYGAEIFSDSINLLVNGKVTGIYRKRDVGDKNWFLDTDYQIILSMQLGGAWVGEIDPKQLPAEMHVDWIRYYKYIE